MNLGVTMSDASQELGTEVSNAGLVIASPFIPELFSKLQLTKLDQGKVIWRDHDSAMRGPGLLTILATGEQPSASVPSEVPNLLCGLEPDRALSLIAATDVELQAVSNLIDALMARWQPLERTSSSSLRDCFLQRPGKLQRQGNGWRFALQKNAFDAVLDRVPWSFTNIALPWMPLPLITVDARISPNS